MPKPISFAGVGQDAETRADDLDLILQVAELHPMDIQTRRIQANPYQARKTFDNLESLIAAMKVQGFQSRLRVRPHPTERGKYQLLYGERRLRAAIAAGILVIPCDVVEADDKRMKEVGLMENLHRKELEPLEEARAYQLLMEEDGYSQRSLADQLGMSRGYIQSRLDLLRMGEDVQGMVESRPDTVSAARLVNQLPAEERAPLIAQVVEEQLPYAAVKQIVAERRPATRPGNVSTLPPHAQDRTRINIGPDVTAIERIFARWRGYVAEGQIESGQVVAAIEQVLGKGNRLLHEVAE